MPNRCFSIQSLSTAVTVFFVALVVALSVGITTYYSDKTTDKLALAQARLVSETLAGDARQSLCLAVGFARGLQISANVNLIPALRSPNTSAADRLEVASKWIAQPMQAYLGNNLQISGVNLGLGDETYLGCRTESKTNFSCQFIDGLNASAGGNLTSVREHRIQANGTLLLRQIGSTGFQVTTEKWYTNGSTLPAVIRWGSFGLSSYHAAVIDMDGSLEHNGAHVGVLSLTWNLDGFCRYLRSASKNTDATVFLLDHTDQVLVHNLPGLGLATTYTDVMEVSLHRNYSNCIFYAASPGTVDTVVCRKSLAEIGFAPLAELARASRISSPDGVISTKLDGRSYYVAFTTLQHNSDSWRMVTFLSHASVVGGLPNRILWGITFGAGLVVVVSLVGGILLALLLRPLRQLSECIKHTASLSDDGLRGMPSTNILDVERIRIALNFLCCELAKTKSFLPETVVAPMDSEDWDEGSLSEYGSSDLETSKKSSSVHVTDHPQLPSIGHRQRGPTGLNTALRVQHRRTSVLCVNIRGFHQMTKLWSLDEFSRKYAEVCAVILKTSRQRKGVLDLFHGDRFFVTYNAFVSAANHALAAALTAVTLLVEMPQIQVTCGVAAGIALVGTTGNVATKRTAVVGEVFSAAVLMERLCKYYPHANPILTCGSAAVDSSIQTETVHVDVVRVPGATNPRILTSIRSERTAAVAEWMYELEDVIAESRYSKLNDAFVSFHEGNSQKATEKLDGCDTAGSDVEAPKQLLRSLIAAGVDGTLYYNPLNHYYANCVCSANVPFTLPQVCEETIDHAT